jgi:hypothetical protein
MKNQIQRFKENLETNLYGVLIILSFILMFNVSCSTLKYDPDYEPDMEEFQDHYEFCKPFWDMGSSEIYMECMMNEEIRSRLTTTPVPTNDLYTTTHSNTSTST